MRNNKMNDLEKLKKLRQAYLKQENIDLSNKLNRVKAELTATRLKLEEKVMLNRFILEVTLMVALGVILGLYIIN